MSGPFSRTVLYAPYNPQRIWPPVNSKRDFVRRYKAGEFGNCSPTWDSMRDWMENCTLPLTDRFHLRNRVAGGWDRFCTGDEIGYWWDYSMKEGVKPDQLYISAMCPHERGTIQGEVMEGPQGLELFWASAKKPMREALRGGRTEIGLKATSMLRHYLCPNSHDWMMTLLERYPGHVVEFTSLSTNWGTLPNFNTLFWECRNY